MAQVLQRSGRRPFEGRASHGHLRVTAWCVIRGGSLSRVMDLRRARDTCKVYFGLAFCHASITGRAWRKQSTPAGMPQYTAI
jgi:hypothetical protein